uniref:Bulb-type lectin domain-containing protein n=1 Tax=Quercus lobata TaxID=97700 RepID=A0A7N2MP85_QUELO
MASSFSSVLSHSRCGISLRLLSGKKPQASFSRCFYHRTRRTLRKTIPLTLTLTLSRSFSQAQLSECPSLRHFIAQASLTWQSQSGFYAFGLYQQANGYAVGVFFFAGIPEKTVVWTAIRDKAPALASVTLNFTSDGRLIMQSAQGVETAIADLPERAASASMLDSGNFVLYTSDKKIIWQSFESPTNTLLQDQRLTAGNELLSV